MEREFEICNGVWSSTLLQTLQGGGVQREWARQIFVAIDHKKASMYRVEFRRTLDRTNRTEYLTYRRRRSKIERSETAFGKYGISVFIAQERNSAS